MTLTPEPRLEHVRKMRGGFFGQFTRRERDLYTSHHTIPGGFWDEMDRRTAIGLGFRLVLACDFGTGGADRSARPV